MTEQAAVLDHEAVAPSHHKVMIEQISNNSCSLRYTGGMFLMDGPRVPLTCIASSLKPFSSCGKLCEFISYMDL